MEHQETGYTSRMNDEKEARGGDEERPVQGFEGKLKELYCGIQRESDQKYQKLANRMGHENK